jgi:predicted metal-dependent hydrolase
MTILHDDEFGDISVRRVARARYVRIKLGNDGRYIATAPPYTPMIFIKRMIKNSREELRKLAEHSNQNMPYAAEQQIGQHHSLAVVYTGMVSAPSISVIKNRLVVKLPLDIPLENTEVQQLIRDQAAKILRKEAKAELPDKLADLAKEYGFSYQKLRFTHSTGRWGSCTSAGTISLNIALMKLPDELIRYVLAHELCHTRQMNHSPAFWNEVAVVDPHFKLHRRQLKRENPAV